MNGVINVIKPKGISSFEAVRVIRSICGEKRVGHTGTLDPLASGVLPICIGKGTKIIDYIMENTKTYKTTLRLGIETDTYDMEGKVIREREVPLLDNENIIKIIKGYEGDIMQIPPMYSALKVNGKRLYDLARQGIEINRAARPVSIYSIDIISVNLPFVTMRVTCSKGTYIRSLCKDIGDTLECGAVMTELIRESSGNFNLNNSVNLYDIDDENIENFIIPLEEALKDYDAITVNDKFSRLLTNGVSIKDKALFNNKIIESRLYRVYSEENILLGIGQKSCSGFKIKKLLL